MLYFHVGMFLNVHVWAINQFYGSISVMIDELGILDGLQTLSYFGQKQDSWYVLSIMQSAFLQYPVCYKCVF